MRFLVYANETMRYYRRHRGLVQVAAIVAGLLLSARLYGIGASALWNRLGVSGDTNAYLVVYVPFVALGVLGLVYLYVCWRINRNRKGKMLPPQWWTEGHPPKAKGK